MLTHSFKMKIHCTEAYLIVHKALIMYNFVL